MMATHPPIEQRIKAIDPTWDGKYAPLDSRQAEAVRRQILGELKPKAPPLPDSFRTVLGGVILSSGTTWKPPVIKTRYVLPNLWKPNATAFEIRRRHARRVAGKSENCRARTA